MPRVSGVLLFSKKHPPPVPLPLLQGLVGGRAFLLRHRRCTRDDVECFVIGAAVFPLVVTYRFAEQDVGFFEAAPNAMSEPFVNHPTPH